MRKAALTPRPLAILLAAAGLAVAATTAQAPAPAHATPRALLGLMDDGLFAGQPDVAFQASAGTGALVYITLPPDGNSGLLCGGVPCSTGWYDIGGTSLSTPQWAGLVAIADQLNGRLGPINTAL